MIIQNATSNATIVGDVAEHFVSIDPRNVEHIITILSSNLYSHPEQSFLRETVSNAVDSHKEAGVEEPIILSIIKHASYVSEYTISVRDFGTGISPERFNDIYLNIGSSTKRESNDYIGSFGIGRFSALACANAVHITSYYNGKQYTYLMMKNDNRINIDLVDTKDTTERNGVEVKIVVHRVDNYVNALCSLWFIPNLYVNSNVSRHHEIISEFNNRKLITKDNFAVNNCRNDDGGFMVLIGNILYKLSSEYTPSKYDRYYKDEQVLKRLILKFQIGELDVTPNREQLLYSERTIAALNKKYEELENEFADICRNYVMTPISDIFDFGTKCNCPCELPIESETIRITPDCYFYKFLNFKYDAKKEPEFARNLRVQLAIDKIKSIEVGDYCVLFSKKGLLTKSKSDFRFSRLLLTQDVNFRIFCVPSIDGFRGKIWQDYVKSKIEKFSDNTYFLFTTRPIYKFKWFYENGFGVANENNDGVDIHKTIWLFREVSKTLSENVCIQDIANSKDFLTFKEEELKRRKIERQNKKLSSFVTKIILYVNCGDRFNSKTSASNVKEMVDNVNRITCHHHHTNKNIPVYWSTLDDVNTGLLKRALDLKYKKYVIVQIAKTHYKTLKSTTLPANWQEVTSELLLNHRSFKQYITSYKFGTQLNSRLADYIWYFMYRNESLFRVAPKTLTEAEKAIVDAYSGSYDLNMLLSYERAEKANKMSENLWDIYEMNEFKLSPLFWKVAFEKKLIPFNVNGYKQLKRLINDAKTN